MFFLVGTHIGTIRHPPTQLGHFQNFHCLLLFQLNMSVKSVMKTKRVVPPPPSKPPPTPHQERQLTRRAPTAEDSSPPPPLPPHRQDSQPPPKLPPRRESLRHSRNIPSGTAPTSTVSKFEHKFLSSFHPPSSFPPALPPASKTIATFLPSSKSTPSFSSLPSFSTSSLASLSLRKRLPVSTPPRIPPRAHVVEKEV